MVCSLQVIYHLCLSRRGAGRDQRRGLGNCRAMEQRGHWGKSAIVGGGFLQFLSLYLLP